jgi:hypothetical protein
MQLRLLVPVFLQRSLLLVLCIALNGCQSHKANSGPSIEFTHIPPAAQGGRERVDTISGRVRNARPNQQIVIYAQQGMVGAALAALPRIVTEIDGVAPAHSRTYRNILSAVGVLCADRMPLFTKKFSFNGCFQQGPRRSGEPLQNRYNRRW